MRVREKDVRSRVGCITRTRSGTLVAFLCVALLVPAGIASAGRPHRASVASEVQSAGKLAGKIPKSRFAPHERAQLLAAARRAVRLARTKRTCAALAAADAFLNALNAPTTWHKRQISKRLVRKPLSLLAGASRSLLHAAGRKCARAAAVHKLVPHTGGAGSSKVQPPATDPEQGGGLNHPIPPGKTILPKTIGGGSALGADPHGGLSSAADPLARIATPTLSFFRNSDVGVPPRTASPQEPTTAIAPAAGVVWYTGNTSDALSTDNGRTFTTFDPSNVLPDQGLAYCCDQVVSYSPQYNIFVWVSQYWCNKSCLVSDGQNPPHNVCRTDGVFNRIRIAVATPQALRANASNPGAAWTYWDITPGTVGQPGNAWFDRSDMSVNPWNMNWGVDIICGNSGNLLSRISLAQLAARGTVTLGYITDNGARTTSQGLGTTTTYFAGSNSGSQARIWSWAPFSGTLFRHDINHSSVPIYNNAINGTDHGNWYDRYGIFPGEVESATISGNTLYTAMGTGRAYCTANCSTNSPTLNQVFNEPAVLITKYDVNTWAETGERWLWNPTLAFGWPALSTDVAGDVGIALRTSADNQNAQPVAGFLTPSEQFFYADPAGQPYETGDYYSLRPGRTSQSFVMTAQTVQNDPGGAAMHWFYIEYGLGARPYVSPPSVHITAPANLSSYLQGATAGYSATVSDPIDGTLPSGAIRWTEDGTQIGTGASISHVESSVGTHVVQVTATNGDGKSASASITIRVVAPLPPNVSITSPTTGAQFSCSSSTHTATVQFTATASDPNSPPEGLTYSWTDGINGGSPTQLSTQLSPSLSLPCSPPAGARTTTHTVTLTATNTSGKSSAAQVLVNTIGPSG
jgi:PKD domain